MSTNVWRRSGDTQTSSTDGHGPKEQRTVMLRVVAALSVGLAVCVAALGYGSSLARADECANAALRAQNNSSGLPDCRSYEMVTPPYKEGFTIAPGTFSDDGAVAFVSSGVFGSGGGGIGTISNQYVSTRSSAGWTTVAPNLPTGTYDTLGGNGAEALSADLRSALWRSTRRVTPADGALYYYLVRLDGAATRVGPGAVPAPGLAASDQVPYTQGGSADLSHILFAHGGAGSGNQALAALYEFVGTGHTGPGRLVSVDNDGQQVPGQACPAGMSRDGRVIFFQSGCNGGVTQVWARVGGSATVAVSGSECTRAPDDPAGACDIGDAAGYVGSATDGSRVFLTTDQQLVDGDTDTTTDLYACDIPDGAPAPAGSANSCSALREISGAAGSARVQSVPAVSADGSRVYFVARGVLADNLGTSSAPAVEGGDNLYLWSLDAAHPEGQISFVTDLAGGGIASARTTSDGRYLVFGTSAPLVQAGPGNDTDLGASDLYRYDAETAAMVRVSTGVSGSGGNTPSMDVSTTNVTMTGDGSAIVFLTNEALSDQDVDGVSDAYAWKDGQVSLISDGRTGATGAWITPSGRDIFFSTVGRLTPLDGDVNEDIYDARVGGGFDLRRPAPCFGDSCRAQPSPVPSLPGPSGTGSRGGDSDAVVPGFSLGRVSATQRRRFAQTGKITLAIKTNTAGVVVVSGSVTGLPGAVRSVRKTVAVPGTVRLTVALSKKARARLAARGRLSVRLNVSHSKVALNRSVTLGLTHTKVKAKAKRGSVQEVSAERAVENEGGPRS